MIIFEILKQITSLIDGKPYLSVLSQEDKDFFLDSVSEDIKNNHIVGNTSIYELFVDNFIKNGPFQTSTDGKNIALVYIYVLKKRKKSIGCSMIYCSPFPIKSDGSTSHSITSASLSVAREHPSIYSPSLFFALFMPGVSRKTICPLSSVNTVWMRFRVVWGLLEVIATFWPMIAFISVDLPTFGRPIIATYPDLKLAFSILLLRYIRSLDFARDDNSTPYREE